MQDYKVPSEVDVDDFFKTNSALLWNVSNFLSWKKSSNPFIDFSTVKTELDNNLEKIKNSALVPDAIKSNIYKIKKDAKGKRPIDPRPSININYNNSTHNGGNFLGFTSAPDTAHTAAAHTAASPDTIATVYTAPNHTLSSLYDHVYKLYNKQTADASSLAVLPCTSNINMIYNACVRLLQKFDTLNITERSYLHVLLSSCLNTICASYRSTLASIIGQDTLTRILTANSQLKSFHAFNCDVYQKMKSKIQEAYILGEIKGVKLFLIKEKQRIIQEDREEADAFQLKIIDIFEFILNMVQHRDWTATTLTEEDFGFYWKYVIEIIFRGSRISLKRGESCSTSTKTDRQINELEYGECSKSIFGRKIDLIFAASIVNDAHQEVLIELSALEIKPAAIATNVEVIQLNKNIRVNKSILHHIYSHIGKFFIDDLSVLGMDVIGLSGFIYRVKQYEDITVACKASEENIFLPADEEDFEDFIYSDSLDQLLNYWDITEAFYREVKKVSKKFKRLRVSSKNSAAVDPVLRSLPRQEYSFPSDTFFTPKKTRRKSASN
ncbi:hypothetical protein PS15m_011532 [Mucor circinelloides]